MLILGRARDAGELSPFAETEMTGANFGFSAHDFVQINRSLLLTSHVPMATLDSFGLGVRSRDPTPIARPTKHKALATRLARSRTIRGAGPRDYLRSVNRVTSFG